MNINKSKDILRYMIPNCKGCEVEYETLMMYSHLDYKLFFAGSGLYEKGHLILILVNSKGEIILR